MITELSFKDSAVRKLVCAAFPGAKTRRPVRVRTAKTYHVADYWDSGSRTYSAFVNLSTGQALTSEALPKIARQVIGNPFNLPIGDIELGSGFAVVEHTIFCGKDLGYRIVVGEDDTGKLPCVGSPVLTTNEAPALPAKE
jgi:hypothetical protein